MRLQGTMDIFDAIQGRKSIRRFKRTPVPDADIRKILNAGRLAPSANNAQPWSFLVIKDRGLLGKMADAIRAMIDRMLPFAENEKQRQRLAAYKGRYYTFFEHAPVVIAVVMEAYDSGTDRILARMGYSAEDIKKLRPSPDIQSVAAAIQNMLLAVYALGYGSCWMTGPAVAQDAFKNLLRYKEDRYITALLPIGEPDENPRSRSRIPLDELMRTVE